MFAGSLVESKWLFGNFLESLSDYLVSDSEGLITKISWIFKQMNSSILYIVKFPFQLSRIIRYRYTIIRFYWFLDNVEIRNFFYFFSIRNILQENLNIKSYIKWWVINANYCILFSETTWNLIIYVM